MKCKCTRCGGDGVVEITCDDCNGEGTTDFCISTLDFSNRRELKGNDLDFINGLKADALRCKEQAARLKDLNPDYAASYDRQLKSTLTMINGEAEEFFKNL